MYLGEVLNAQQERWEVQLKGAGRTHYSRSADGRKVLRSSLREFLCSEACHALGVPTTRAGSIVTSDTFVERDLRYDGNVKKERASVVMRIAPSFLRFGSFEICRSADPITGRSGPSEGQFHILARLLDYVSSLILGEPTCDEAAAPPPSTPALPPTQQRLQRWARCYDEIVQRTAELVAHWQAVGFCHGVLNTDNMSVLGLTIDYGPFGFMETFDPQYVCNMSDSDGRYEYGAQPTICEWNCEVLAESLAPILPKEATAESLGRFIPTYRESLLRKMRAKLGLLLEEASDASLVDSLCDTMASSGADYTSTFRALHLVPAGAPRHSHDLDEVAAKILDSCITGPQMAEGLRARAKGMQPRIPEEQLRQLLQIAQTQPQALSMLGEPAAVRLELIAEWEKSKKAQLLLHRAEALSSLDVLEKRRRDRIAWLEWLHAYSSRLQQEEVGTESCPGRPAEARRATMLATNPRVVLRNWIAQEAISAAERGDFAAVGRVFQAVTQPYTEGNDLYGGRNPNAEVSGLDLCVS